MLSSKTIRNIVLNLSAAIKKAAILKLISKNPYDTLTFPKLQRFESDIFSMEKVAQLLNCGKNTALYLSMMIEICLCLRRGELLTLKWHHVDFEEGLYKC